MTATGIEWTEATWNPIVGCSLASPGCTNCYAMTMAARIEGANAVADPLSRIAREYDGTTRRVNGKAVWTGKLALADDHKLTAPLRRKKPTTYFVNSMGDLFHEDAPDEWIDKVFAVMALAPQHTFQVLTKRSARMREHLSNPRRHYIIARALLDLLIAGALPKNAVNDDAWPIESEGDIDLPDDVRICRWPLPNVWLGVSTEDQRRADERIPHLLATPAAIRFISAEPLLGPIDLTRVGNIATIRAAMPAVVQHEERGRLHLSGFQIEAVGPAGSSIEFFQTPDHMGGFTASSPRRVPRLDWVIAGGESGNGARPSHPDWFRDLRDQCAAAGIPFFFKQWGEWADSEDWPSEMQEHYDVLGRTDGNTVRVGKARAGRLLDGIEHNGMPGRDGA